MITVKNLTKMYANNYAIRDVSFHVAQGEIVGFLGPNGAGKTTAMRIITCAISATSGTALVNDCNVFEDSLYVRRAIGYLPENIPLYPELSVKAYLTFMANLKNVPRRILPDEIDRVALATGITDMIYRPTGRLSKGYRQRVGLAQALLGDPEILILDEPTVGLDPAQIKSIRSLINELGKEKTIILSTHILPEVEAICDRIIIINKGRIVAESGQSDLAQNLSRGTEIRVSVRGPATEVGDVLRSLPDVLSFEPLTGAPDGELRAKMILQTMDSTETVARTVVERGWGLRDLHVTQLSLEDIFVSLVTEENQQGA